LTQAAGQVNAHAAQAGLDPTGRASMTASHLCEYEQWPAASGRKPSPHVLALLAHTYNTSIHHLLDIDDWEHLSPADRLLLNQQTGTAHEKTESRNQAGRPEPPGAQDRVEAQAPTRQAPTPQAPTPQASVPLRRAPVAHPPPRPPHENGLPRPPGALGAALPGMNDRVLTPDDEERLALALRRPSRVDIQVIDSLSSILAEQRATEDVVGSARLLIPVQAQVAELTRLAADTRGRVRGRLLAVAAQWAQFAGWLAISTERYAQARAWLDRAAEWAAEVGDANLHANALSFKGHLAFQLGDLGAVIGLSRAAGRDPRVWVGQRAEDAYQEARAHAVAGDVNAAVAKLGDAADLAAATAENPDSTPPWQYYYTPPFYAVERGLVYRYLGRDDPAHNERAIASFTAGLDGLGESRHSEWGAEFVCHLAAAYIQAGAPDLAGAAGIEAATVAQATDSTRLSGKLQRLHASLAERWPSHPTLAHLSEILHRSSRPYGYGSTTSTTT
jgi:hypothetical protein